MEPFTLAQASRALTDESFAWTLFESFRWPGGPECPHCHERERVTYLAPREGVRRTRTGKVSHRRLWKCNECHRQFTALIGTIFEDSRIPLGKWLMGVYLMASAKNGVSAHELHRDLQMTYKTSWFMCHRLRLAMSLSPAAEVWEGGTIVADETWIGGEPGNRHAVKEVPVPIGPGKGPRPNQHTDKTPVLSLINTDTGEVRSRVMPDLTTGTIRKAIADQVEITGSTLYTDAARHYVMLGREFAAHESVNHEAGEYVRGPVSTNRAEGYFSQLKRSLDGTHHHVSREHLSRYTGEFDFRYSTRKMADSERAVRMVEQSQGRRISYARLTGRGVRPPISGRRPNPRG